VIAATLPASLFAAIPLAIAAGFISFASPCVLPLVPGYLAFLTGAAGRLEGRAGRGRAFIGSIAFIAGFTIVFVSFGGVVRGLWSTPQRAPTHSGDRVRRSSPSASVSSSPVFGPRRG
jgi:cytochrome c-type biogenesis protein